MVQLAEKSCAACATATAPLDAGQIKPLLQQLPGWSLNGQGHLERTYTFPDFSQALRFVDKVGALADSEDHHPEIRLGWGKAVVEIWTHKIKGLAEGDFVFAAKVDRIPR